MTTQESMLWLSAIRVLNLGGRRGLLDVSAVSDDLLPPGHATRVSLDGCRCPVLPFHILALGRTPGQRLDKDGGLDRLAELDIPSLPRRGPLRCLDHRGGLSVLSLQPPGRQTAVDVAGVVHGGVDSTPEEERVVRLVAVVETNLAQERRGDAANRGGMLGHGRRVEQVVGIDRLVEDICQYRRRRRRWRWDRPFAPHPLLLAGLGLPPRTTAPLGRSTATFPAGRLSPPR